MDDKCLFFPNSYIDGKDIPFVEQKIKLSIWPITMRVFHRPAKWVNLGKNDIFLDLLTLKVQVINCWCDLKQLGGRIGPLGMCSGILTFIPVLLSLQLSRKVGHFGQKWHFSRFLTLEVQIINWWCNLKQLGGRIRPLGMCSVILTLIPVILSL